MLRKRILALLLAAMLLLSVLPADALAAEVKSGSCGDNLHWTLSNGVLTISGTGAMKDYAAAGYDPPWLEHEESITSLVVENGVTRLGDYAFMQCTKLETVSLPNSLISIGQGAFWRCKALKSVSIPDSVTELEHSIFKECSSLTQTKLPKGITVIPGSMFESCTSLKSFVIPDTVTVIDSGAFYACNTLTQITIPDSVTEIGAEAFGSCAQLTKIDLPANLQKLGNQAFSFSGLETVTVPRYVTKVGSAFYCAQQLESVTFEGNAPLCEDDLFGYIEVTVYYPSNNNTWSEAYRQNYGGTVTWVPYESSFVPDPIVAQGTVGDGLT